jgi:glycosyltransferase involved in cell wall biosynthesis
MDAGLFLKRVRDLFKLFLTGRIFKELVEVKSKMKATTKNWHKIFLTEKEQHAKISVVIPTLNESGYIKNPILSLKAGSYSNYEVIVVDCMSQDDTAEKARKLGAKVVLSKKRNVGYQTHLGFMSATGKIIVRTDADTIFPQDTLVKIADTFEKEHIAVYHVGHLYYDGNVLLNLLAHLYDKYWRRIWNTTGYFIAVRKSVYEKAVFKSLAKGQDYDFGKRAYEIFGHKAFAFDSGKAVLISSRAVRKQGLIRYLVRQGSFRSRRTTPAGKIPTGRGH